MRHRAAGRNLVVTVGQNAGGTLTAADVGSAGTEDSAVVALCTAGAELEHRTTFCRTRDAVRLGGDQGLVVDGQQDHGFDKLCLDHRPGHRYERLARKYRRTLGYGPYVAFKLKIAQIIEEGLREALAAAKICNILLGKMQVVEVFNQLFHACHDGISAAVRYTAEEHIEVCAAVADTLFEVSVRHRKLVKVSEHG